MLPVLRIKITSKPLGPLKIAAGYHTSQLGFVKPQGSGGRGPRHGSNCCARHSISPVKDNSPDRQTKIPAFVRLHSRGDRQWEKLSVWGVMAVAEEEKQAEEGKRQCVHLPREGCFRQPRGERPPQLSGPSFPSSFGQTRPWLNAHCCPVCSVTPSARGGWRKTQLCWWSHFKCMITKGRAL